MTDPIKIFKIHKTKPKTKLKLIKKQLNSIFSAKLDKKQIQRNDFEPKINTKKITENFLSFFKILKENSIQNPFDLMKEHFGFNLYKKKSSIDNAGFGVFTNGFIPKGSLVAIYPGKKT